MSKWALSIDSDLKWRLQSYPRSVYLHLLTNLTSSFYPQKGADYFFSPKCSPLWSNYGHLRSEQVYRRVQRICIDRFIFSCSWADDLLGIDLVYGNGARRRDWGCCWEEKGNEGTFGYVYKKIISFEVKGQIETAHKR